MKTLFHVSFLLLSNLIFSQNQSYRIISDSINPLIESGNYADAKLLWLSMEKEHDVDPQEEYLFLCSSLRSDDVLFFKKRMKRLIKESGFNFTGRDTLPENLYGHNDLFYQKGVISWMIETSKRFHTIWIKNNPQGHFLRHEIELLVLKDQYIRANFGPSSFADSLCDNEEKYWETIGRADFQNMADLTTLCIRNNGIPNHFDHGTETYYLLGLIVWHNLKNPNNRDNAWNIFLPWLDKAYFEGKIGSDMYEAYDFWLFEQTGKQFYGFQGNAPILNPESFEERVSRYGFIHD